MVWADSTPARDQRTGDLPCSLPCLNNPNLPRLVIQPVSSASVGTVDAPAQPLFTDSLPKDSGKDDRTGSEALADLLQIDERAHGSILRGTPSFERLERRCITLRA